MKQMCGKKSPSKEDVKKMQLEIDKLNLEQKFTKKKIQKIYASIRTIKKGKLISETNELRRNALFARVAEMEAQIDVEHVKIEVIKFKKTQLQNQLEAILAVEPEPILRREQLPPKAENGSPPLMVPPDPPRIAHQ